MKLVRVTVTAGVVVPIGDILKKFGTKSAKVKSYFGAYKDVYSWWLVQRGFRPAEDWRMQDYFDILQKAINTKDYRELSGILHKDNTFSRAVFQHRTGVKLPPTNEGSMKALADWVGKKGMKNFLHEEERRQTDYVAEREARENEEKQDAIRPFFNRIPAANRANDASIRDFLLNYKFSNADTRKKAADKLTRLVKGDDPVTEKPGVFVYYAHIERYIKAGYYLDKGGQRLNHPKKREYWKPPSTGWLFKYAKWLLSKKR